MDSNDDPALELDERGWCQHCRKFEADKRIFVREGEAGEAMLADAVRRMKEEGSGKPYDCLIGVSGGVDSSYVAYMAHKLGLRALCVHFDNGWNSELAVKNIENMVARLGFDLYTYVIDWQEFRDLQLAYLRASVVDIEVLTDHAIYGSTFRIAKERQIKYVIGGNNVATEGVLPYHWTYNKKDHVNIRAIHKAFGQGTIKSYPFLDRKMKKFIAGSGVTFINYLNWMPYEKDEVKRTLIRDLDWRDYGGKHYESIWTRFYQGYILPEKFGIDKRKAHFSSLICAGQMTRDQALEEMRQPAYDPALLREDRAFVLKKLGLSDEDFEEIMHLPVRDHRSFDTEGSVFHDYPVIQPLRPLWEGFKRWTGWRR
ncbi:MAG: N-acetyl sugar amidotransferase [Chitinophagaceae bacterium]|nr:N-acetyl sugar amidotransferase [Chitinophagaceae bacterium]